MNARDFRITAVTALGMLVLAASGAVVAQQSEPDRRTRGEEMVRTLNAGQDQPNIEKLRRDFPFLADAVTDYALGEVWARPGLDHRTRQIATVAAFAALGHRSFMKIHAGYALNLGVTPEELKEVVYLTTVHAGFPRAIEAAQTLTELLDERARQPGAPR